MDIGMRTLFAPESGGRRLMRSREGFARARMLALGVVAVAAGLVALPVAAQPTSPVITLQPTNVTASEGQDVVLAVAADGQPPLSYQWLFNGSAFADATNSVLQFPD